MKPHIAIVLLLTLLASSCASQQSRTVSSLQENQGEQFHHNWVGGQQDRLR